MKLFLISQTTNQDWDTYDAAVVAAETADEAKQIHPSGDYHPTYPDYRWVKPQDVVVRLVGEAVPGTEHGVVLASFNAG